MPPAPPDASVGRAGGPVGIARRRPARIEGRGRRPGSSRSEAPRSSGALETLLVDLGSQIHRGSEQLSRARADAPRFLPTGLPELDARLGGGLPVGRLSEIGGVRSSGRTSLALRLVAETLGQGRLVAWIDLADAFAPGVAAEAIEAHGGRPEDLERLLWVRARSEEQALRSSERLLRTEGFELVVLDRCASGPPPRGVGHRARAGGDRAHVRLRDAAWRRLARLAAGTRTALVVLSDGPVTGACAELVLEMQPLRVCFSAPPSLLEALETRVVLQRHRGRPTGDAIPLRIRADADLPDPPRPD